MRVHHLKCGEMTSISRADGTDPMPAVCHVLLVETDADGLALVETGFGTASLGDPRAQLGHTFVARAQPTLDPSLTAHAQIRGLGLDPADVRHIVLTHLDVDHAAGIADFPQAQIHLHASEFRAAMGPGGHPEDAVRYRPAQWAHGASWVTYSSTDGDPWFGFDAVRTLEGLAAEILLVPLGGHTLGHSAVAVHNGSRWLLHAGDAYYYHGELEPAGPVVHPLMDLLTRVAEVDRPLRLANLARLRELHRLHGDEVEIFCAHDPWELAALQSVQPAIAV